MRSLIVGVLAVALLAGQPRAARAHNGAQEAGLALGATAVNVVYTPCKMAVAVAGLIVGGIAGFLTGGDARTAYALWVPAAGGTFMVRPSNLDGSVPIEFFGSDYADRPSPAARSLESSNIYEALYK